LPRRPPRAAQARAARPVRLARVFVDSSAWIAFFSQRDQNHDAADAFFRRAVADSVTLLTTNLVIAEIHRLTLFRAGIAAGAAVLARVDGSPRVHTIFATATHHDAAKLWLRKLSDQTITYADAISFAIMESEGCPSAMTFDHDFATAGFQIWAPRARRPKK
jgi:predicted nucleic acid-binding protein